MPKNRQKPDVGMGIVLAVFGLLTLGLTALFLLLSCGHSLTAACLDGAYGGYGPALILTGTAVTFVGLALSIPEVRVVPAAPFISPYAPAPLMPAPQYSKFYTCDVCGQPLTRIPGRRGWYCSRCERRR